MLTDKSGQYRRNCGYKKTANGKIGSARFYLGFDKDQALVAETRLAAFWQGLEDYFAQQRDGEAPQWEAWSYSIAQQIAKGKMVVKVEAPDSVHESAKGNVAVWSGWLNLLRRYFGMVVGFELPNKAEADAAQAERGEYFAKIGHDILASVGKGSSGGTLHGAITAYVAYLHKTHKTVDGIVNQTGKKQGERAERLKKHHVDVPLYDLDAKKIEEILLYWSKRPIIEEDKRYSRNTCKNQLILIRAFLRWVHRSDLNWKLPADFLFPRMKIDWLPAEISAEPNKKRTFTLKEVGTLWSYATPLERVFIALAINCGFGEGEIATLAESEINGEYIKRLRHKTKVFGAWWMYPVTMAAIEFARKRKKVLGLESPFLLITESGKPYHAVTKGNNRTQKIRASWTRLIARIKEKEEEGDDFPVLSFGKLRKTAASWVRKVGGGELSSIFVAHGKATGDALLDLYADRQFRRLFKCQKKIWEKLKGVLTGGFPEPTHRRPKTSPDDRQKRRVLKLVKQGYKLTKIAEITGIPYSTCRRLALAKPGV